MSIWTVLGAVLLLALLVGLTGYHNQRALDWFKKAQERAKNDAEKR